MRPQEEGNVGAVARAMANLGLERLILVEPAVALGETARAFAVHAGEILARAERRADLASAVAGFGRIVATTAARNRQWPQRLVTPRELPGALAEDPPQTSTVLLFGPESSGLTNEELATASLLVRIPTAARQPTLNLAQAVLIVAYELWLGRGAPAALAAPGFGAARHRRRARRPLRASRRAAPERALRAGLELRRRRARPAAAGGAGGADAKGGGDSARRGSEDRACAAAEGGRGER